MWPWSRRSEPRSRLRHGGEGRERPVPLGSAPGGAPGDRRVGVVWHTQGSGKSLTWPSMRPCDPAPVHGQPYHRGPHADRNDLDDQLFGRSHAAATSCDNRRSSCRPRPISCQLAVAAGGVVFTTIPEVLPRGRGDRHPVLSDRRNIVVIADEAPPQSSTTSSTGSRRHMRDALPHASFVGFTAHHRKTDATHGRCLATTSVSMTSSVRSWMGPR